MVRGDSPTGRPRGTPPSEPPRPEPRTAYHLTAVVAGVSVVALAGLVLLGWALDVGLLKSVLPDTATMKPNAAVGILLAGLALVAAATEGRAGSLGLRASAAACLAIGLATLLQDLTGIDLGIDQLLFAESPGTVEVGAPGRMATTSALGLVGIGAGLLLQDGGRHQRLAQGFVIGTAVLSLVALIGYLYGVEPLYGLASYSHMALHTSVALLVLSAGILAARPNVGLMAVITSDSPGGQMARRLIPAAIALPIVLGLLRLLGQRAGHYGTEFGLSVMTLGMVVILTGLIVWSTATVNRLHAGRRRAEGALAQAEARYEILFDNATDIIYSHDLEGRFTTVNNTAERLLGYGPHELIGRNIADLVAPESLALAREKISAKVLGVAEATVYELEVLCKDGSRLPVEVSTRLIMGDGRAVGVEGIARDIRERRRLEDQLRHSQKMEAVGRLAGGVAHDFNNLLTAILGYCKLLSTEIASDEPIREDVLEIESAARRAAALTGQLLAFSRQQVLQPQVLDLNATVSDIERMLRRLIGEDVQLVTRLSADLGRVRVDPSQIEQIVVNLAVNARDAMPRGGKLVIETANVDLDRAYAARHVGMRAGPHVMVALSDTGHGMDRETQARIFEPFFTTKPVGKGTGLGLSTVYGIVKQSGGSIWAYSEPGLGTTFKVYFPRTADEDVPAEPLERAAAVPRGTETVLLVEDEEAVRTLACRVLEEAGYAVLPAATPEQALAIEASHPGTIHAVVTDVVLPGIGGRQLVERLAVRRNRLATLFISGYTDDAIVHHGVLDAGTPFLQKPFTPDALVRKLREVLAQEGSRA